MARKSNIPLSKLAVRMRDDMVLTGKSANTVKLYLAAVRAMARHYGMAPDRLTEEQVRAWLVHLTVKKSGGRNIATDPRRSEILLFRHLSARLVHTSQRQDALPSGFQKVRSLRFSESEFEVANLVDSLAGGDCE